MNDLLNVLGNRNAYAGKRYLYEIIKDKYTKKHDQLMERICHNLITEDDLKDFGQLLIDVYETGYMRSVEDHKGALEAMGLKANVRKNQPTEHVPIFNQKNQADK